MTLLDLSFQKLKYLPITKTCWNAPATLNSNVPSWKVSPYFKNGRVKCLFIRNSVLVSNTFNFSLLQFISTLTKKSLPHLEKLREENYHGYLETDNLHHSPQSTNKLSQSRSAHRLDSQRFTPTLFHRKTKLSTHTLSSDVDPIQRLKNALYQQRRQNWHIVPPLCLASSVWDGPTGPVLCNEM